MDLNVNASTQALGECLKEINNIGSTVYHNICNGQSNIVPWGTADWAAGIFISLLFVVMLIVLVSIMVLAVRDL